jgi:hypothetical protein
MAREGAGGAGSMSPNQLCGSFGQDKPCLFASNLSPNTLLYIAWLFHLCWFYLQDFIWNNKYKKKKMTPVLFFFFHRAKFNGRPKLPGWPGKRWHSRHLSLKA